MKKSIIIIMLVLVIGVATVLAIVPQESNQYIRIHIRANSNSEFDQSVKYTIKDCIVAAITPLAKDITSFDDMYKVLGDNLSRINNIADSKLAALSIPYRARVSLNKENFPTRSYEDITLEGGIYDALIVELGSGNGDNWWCVAFPPLCFVGEETDGNVDYKSIFSKFKKK